MIKHYTVRDMYTYAVQNNIKLLSTYSGGFWAEYLANSSVFDKKFMRENASFRYYFDNENAVLEDVVTNFVEDVYNHLLINDKKYSELYRIYTLEDAKNDFLNNYNIKEDITKDANNSQDNQYGQRIDNTLDTIGSRTDSYEREVSAYNSEQYSKDSLETDTLGQQQNSSGFTKGNQRDVLGTTIDEDITREKKGYFNTNTSDLLGKHDKYWTTYRFYSYIFMEIKKELLLV